MGRRAVMARTRQRVPGEAPGLAARASTLLLPMVVLLLSAPSVAAQRSATARAVVEIPTVSQLDVEPVSTLASSSDVRTGLLRVRVRANHRWKVVVAVPAGLDEPVWVRSAGSGTYHRLEPGSETVIASGAGGETEMRVEYRWELGTDEPAALPLTYTLASL